jgi:hypothetical protein
MMHMILQEMYNYKDVKDLLDDMTAEMKTLVDKVGVFVGKG